MEHSQLIESAKKIYPQILRWRRHLHQYPELSFQEENTSLFLQKVLKEELKLTFSIGWGGHGIVGILKGDLVSDRVVALRADMDGLPIQEKNDASYASKNQFCMHACGHDVHMACLLGSLALLKEYKHTWGGTVKFIFQPGEEQLPGGASKLISEGVLENPQPQWIIGQHVTPGMATGELGITPGTAMASSDEIFVNIKGKGGHAAQPHLTKDPIYATAQFILQAQALISRFKPAMVSSVLSFGKINSLGGATNIIPDEVSIEGTFRSLDEEWRLKAHGHLSDLALGLSQSLGLKIEMKIRKGYPVLYNNEKLALQFKDLINNKLGINTCHIIPARLTSEDFAYYSNQIPSIFSRLGVGFGPGVHQDNFDIDEEAMITGALVFALSAMYLHYT